MKKLESTAIVTSASTITSNYTYDSFQKTIDGDARSYETLRIKELDIKKNEVSLMRFVYSYDNFDNIKTIYRYDNGSSYYSFYEYFSYDEYNQLKYHAQVTGSTERINTYTYDIRGNIQTISKIVLQNGRQSSSSYIILGYETSGWLDQLRYVTIDGVTYNVSGYDVIGNPSNYMDYYINYEQRSIKSITSTDNLIDLHFSYNANGIRTKKYDVYRGIEINYILDGSKILKESRSDGKVLNYFYDQSGSIIEFKYDNSHYYYVKNLQNDIIGITNSNGNLIVKYVYDAYGNIVSINDTSGINLGRINPFRFKSYYYDEETKLYYLNSRYYDPLIGRFINADDIGMLAEDELNLYSYCTNNPITNADPSGYAWWIIGAIAGAVVGGVAGAAISYFTTGKVDWSYVAVGAVAGALIGAGAGYIADKVIAAKTATATASTVATALSADGDPTNEINSAFKIGERVGNWVYQGQGSNQQWVVTTDYSHVGNNMVVRGVTTSDIYNTIQTGHVFSQTLDKNIYITKDFAVVMTTSGELITVMSKVHHFGDRIMQIVERI